MCLMPQKPSRSGDIQSFGIHISKEAVKQPYCLVQNAMFTLDTKLQTKCYFKNIKSAT